MTEMTLFEAINRRQSIRAYRPDPIPADILGRIMRAARLSPSGGNGQGWRFGIITDARLRSELADAAGKQEWIATAPVVVACCSPLYDPAGESDFSREVNRLRWGAGLDEIVAGASHPDAVRMLTNNASPLIPGAHIQLAAAAYGLGTCWIGFLDVMRVGRMLSLPEDWRCYFLITLGYPAEIPARRPRKPLAEITFADNWGRDWAAATDDAEPTISHGETKAVFSDIVNRARPPKPWAEGDNIPWNEPGFSRRMLDVHLSQEHDGASRRFEIIDGHVAWIHQQVLGGKPSRVLDLGCGPGLYSCRLARLGHTCKGIDFSPASVSYAEQTARAEGLSAEFTLGDLRTTPFGTGYDLAMQIFGELNVFRPDQARDLLRNAYDALNCGGRLLLEVSLKESLPGDLARPLSWYSSSGGLFSEKPHLVLTDVHWDEPTTTKTVRQFVIDEDGRVQKCASTYQSYTEDQYRAVLADAGFVDIQRFAGLGTHVQPGFIVLLAVKPA